MLRNYKVKLCYYSFLSGQKVIYNYTDGRNERQKTNKCKITHHYVHKEITCHHVSEINILIKNTAYTTCTSVVPKNATLLFLA